MPHKIPLSDNCLIHEAEADGIMPWTRPPKLTPRLLMALPLVFPDRKQHFTGLRGALWKAFGVDRSSKNPNFCNV